MKATLGTRIISGLSCFRTTQGKISMLNSGRLTPERVVRYALEGADPRLAEVARMHIFAHPKQHVPVLLEHALKVRFNGDSIYSAISKRARSFIFSNPALGPEIVEVLAKEINNPHVNYESVEGPTEMKCKSHDNMWYETEIDEYRVFYIRAAVIDLLQEIKDSKLVEHRVMERVDSLLANKPEKLREFKGSRTVITP